MQADGFGLVGTTIAEKYVVEAVADTGGTAIVYRAFHLPWKRAVALKVFRTPAYVDEASRAALLERFVLEGRILGELSERSSAVLQVCDIGTLTTSSGEWVPYMVLEWLEGATLEQVLEREVAAGLLLRELGQAVALLDPIAEALALAHRRGIVHRDVKPSNLLVVGDPRGPDVTLKLLDFGIAKVVEDAQQRGAYGTTGDREVTAFTPAYGAPEQFSFALGTTGPWTDVFALALVLLAIVSGQAPLPGDTIEELGRAATSTSLRPSLARLGKTRSADVEAVFARAVSVEPSRRYASVDLFWADLKQALDWPDMTKGDRATYDPLCNASGPQRRGMHPANCVSWAQAEAYCAAAGARHRRPALSVGRRRAHRHAPQCVRRRVRGAGQEARRRAARDASRRRRLADHRARRYVPERRVAVWRPRRDRQRLGVGKGSPRRLRSRRSA